MIKTALVAMTVMGCDCDAKLCEFISETPAQWSSVSECETAMKARIIRHSNQNYPLISGLCRTVPQQPEEIAGDPAFAQDAIPTASTRAVAVTRSRSAVYENVMEGGAIMFRRTVDGYEVAKSGLGSLAGRAIGVVKSAGRLIPDRLPGF